MEPCLPAEENTLGRDLVDALLGIGSYYCAVSQCHDVHLGGDGHQESGECRLHYLFRSSLLHCVLPCDAIRGNGATSNANRAEISIKKRGY